MQGPFLPVHSEPTHLPGCPGYLWHLLNRNLDIMSQSWSTRWDLALRVTRCPSENKGGCQNLGPYRMADVMSRGWNGFRSERFSVEMFWGRTIWVVVTCGQNMGGHNVKAPINSGGQLGVKKWTTQEYFCTTRYMRLFLAHRSACLRTVHMQLINVYVINCRM